MDILTMPNKVLVTGGAGFIGSEICKKLLKKKYKVTVIDNLSVGDRKKLPRKVKFIKKDILDFNSCVSACSNIDTIIHLAAKVSIRNSINTFEEDFNNNLVGTINILKAAQKKKIKKIIFASSMAVYSKSKKKKSFKETDLLDPISPYGISKLASEKYLMLMAPKMGIKIVILRIFNTFGPGQTYTPYVGVITIFVKNILKNKICKIFDNGKQRRDFIHVNDVAEAFILALKSKKAINNVFNIGSNKTFSIKKIYTMIKKIIKKGKYKFYPKDNTELDYVCANINKAKKILNFQPKHSLNRDLVNLIKQFKI